MIVSSPLFPSPLPYKTPQQPPARRGITVNVMVENAANFADFIIKAAGGKEYFRCAGAGDKIKHLALDVDGVVVFAGELGNDMDTGDVAHPHVRLHMDSDDPVAMAEKLVKAGAKTMNKCEKQSWGSM